MDVKLGILILLNMAPLQKLVLAPGAIIRGNTVSALTATNMVNYIYICMHINLFHFFLNVK